MTHSTKIRETVGVAAESANTVELPDDFLSAFAATTPLGQTQSGPLPTQASRSASPGGTGSMTGSLDSDQMTNSLGSLWPATSELPSVPLRDGFNAIGATVPFATSTGALPARRSDPGATLPLNSPTSKLPNRPAAPGAGVVDPGATVPLATSTRQLPGRPAATDMTTAGLGATVPFADSMAGTSPALGASADVLHLTSQLDPRDEATAELRAKLLADPFDVDALFKLAVRLHRSGRATEARAAIERLAAVYEQRGQPAQAIRIRHILGDGREASPSSAARASGGDGLAPEAPTVNLPPTRTNTLTGSRGTVDLPMAPTINLPPTSTSKLVAQGAAPFAPAAPTVNLPPTRTSTLTGNAGTVGLPGAPTVSLPPSRTGRLMGSNGTVGLPTAPTMPLSGSTSSLPGGSGAGRGTGALSRLRQTGAIGSGNTRTLRVTGIVGAQAERESDGPLVAAFPPSALTFTIPLPGEEALDDETREVVEESARNLQQGKFNAALDACLYALSLKEDYLPLSIRIAEIYTVQGHRRAARSHAETLLRLLETTESLEHAWMAYRVLLHTTDRDLGSLRAMVQLLIEAGQTEQASYYASRLIRLLDGEGLTDDALAYSLRLCELIPGDTRAALENSVLRMKLGDPGGALNRWEVAVAAGGDPIIARASLAAVMTNINEEDHWRMLAEVAPYGRADRAVAAAILDAYGRTADVMAASPVLAVGRGLLMEQVGDRDAATVLAKIAGDRTASPLARAVGSVVLARLLGRSGGASERGAAVRTALKLLASPEIADHPTWLGLNGTVPRFEDLSLDLGELLLEGQDPAGAAEVLKAAHERMPHHDQLCTRLADAYFKTGQLGAALTVLDGLVAHYRSSGQLEPMAGVLRRMSQMAPNNIKVKARLIDTYLQRGFVAEARAELIQRAELEERSGLIKDAVTSLQRAADLSWNSGMAEETFALYQRAIDLVPDQVDYRHSVVALYLQAGCLAEAAEHQRAIVAISLRAGRKHEAIAALHQTIGLTPDDTSAYYQLGELLGSAGEYRQAERVFRRILTITPDDAIAQAKANSMGALHEGSRAR